MLEYRWSQADFNVTMQQGMVCADFYSVQQLKNKFDNVFNRSVLAVLIGLPLCGTVQQQTNKNRKQQLYKSVLIKN